MTFLLIFSVLAYLLLAAGFVGVTTGLGRKARWLGLGAIAAAAPVFVIVGAFGGSFDANQCYTATIHIIAEAVARSDNPVELAKRIEALPLAGYETSCDALESAAQILSTSHARDDGK